MSGTLVNNHSIGEPLFATSEGLRQQYNYWIRGGIPGITAVIDLDAVSRVSGAGSMGSASASVLAQVPLSQARWDLYGAGTFTLPHPASPGLYDAFAAVFASSGIGA